MEMLFRLFVKYP